MMVIFDFVMFERIIKTGMQEQTIYLREIKFKIKEAMDFPIHITFSRVFPVI